MADRDTARSVKISADERTGWSSDRPRRDGAPPRPPSLAVHCRVLAPADRLRYSPGSLLIVAGASTAERDAFLARLIEDRGSLLSLEKVRGVLAGRVAEEELEDRARELLAAAVNKRLAERQTVVLAAPGLDPDSREPYVRAAAALGRPRHLILLETSRENVGEEDLAPLNELRRSLDAGELGGEGVQTALRLGGGSAAEVNGSFSGRRRAKTDGQPAPIRGEAGAGALRRFEYLRQWPALRRFEYLRQWPALRRFEYLRQWPALRRFEHLCQRPALRRFEYLRPPADRYSVPTPPAAEFRAGDARVRRDDGPVVLAPARLIDPRLLGASAWWIYLTAMLGLSCAYVLAHLTGPGWLNSGPVYNLIGGSTIVAIVLGCRLNRPSPRLPWYLLAIGQTLFLLSNILAYNYEHLFGTALPLPSLADPFHLAFYPFFVAGLAMLIRDRRPAGDRSGTIDALIVTVALAALLWVYLIAPYVDDHGLTLLRRLSSMAYPLGDIVVLGVVARVASGNHRREPAFALLLAAATALLISDVLYGWKLLHGGYNIAGVMASGWAVFFAVLGAAALHPSMRMLSAPAPPGEVRLTRARLALLACASFTVPLVIVSREALHETLDIYVLVGASALIFSLVLLRLANIVRLHEQATEREASCARRRGSARSSATPPT